MRIRISTKSLIYIQIVYNLCVKFFIVDLGVPSVFNYMTDVITIFALVMLMREQHGIRVGKSMRFTGFLVTIYFLLGTLSFIYDYTSLALYLWSIRNIFRFFVFFYVCSKAFTIEDLPVLFGLLEKFFWINALICFAEYLLKGVKFDYLGGIFGNGITGGNGPLNLLLIIMSSYALIRILSKENGIMKNVSIIGVSAFIAAIAELKMFYFELLIVFFVAFFLSKKNMKTIISVTFIFCALILSMKLYAQLYPKSAGFMSMDFVREYTVEKSYGSATDINRLTAISYIKSNIFENDIKKVWFGVGLGNGESSGFYFLISDLYKEYGSRVKYTWFQHAFTFVETGYLGLAILLAFFASGLVVSYKNRLTTIWVKYSIILYVLAFLMVVYNQSLRVESMGYAYYLLLAIPYMEAKNN